MNTLLTIALVLLTATGVALMSALAAVPLWLEHEAEEVSRPVTSVTPRIPIPTMPPARPRAA